MKISPSSTRYPVSALGVEFGFGRSRRITYSFWPVSRCWGEFSPKEKAHRTWEVIFFGCTVGGADLLVRKLLMGRNLFLKIG